MRIVKLKEFMTLKDIMYCEFNKHFEENNFSIKWENCGDPKYNDWVYSGVRPMDIEYQGEYYGDGQESIDKAKVDSSFNIPMDFVCTGREAMYYQDDDPIKFAVYEKEDIKNLINVLQELLEE